MPTSVISNVTKDINGNVAANVTVVIFLQPPGGFRITDASEVAPEYSTVSNGSGSWSVALEQTSNISPSGSYYIVQEQYADAQGGYREYSFTVGAVNATLFASLLAAFPPSPTTNYLTQAQGDARYLPLSTSITGLNVLRVTDYGAVGNGVADDSSAIQAAINAANAIAVTNASNGAIVFFPPGTYNIGTTLSLLRGASLQGASAQASIIRPMPSTALSSMITTASGTGTEWNSSISELMITGRDSTAITTATDGIYITKNSMALRELRIIQFLGKGIRCENFGLSVFHVNVYTCVTGISLEIGPSSGCNATWIGHCVLNNTNKDVYVKADGLGGTQTGITIVATDLEGAATAAVHVEAGGQSVNVIGCRFENNGRMMVTEVGTLACTFAESGGVGASGSPPTQHVTLAGTGHKVVNSFFDYMSVAAIELATAATSCFIEGIDCGANGGAGGAAVTDNATNKDRNHYAVLNNPTAQWFLRSSNGAMAKPTYGFAAHDDAGMFNSTSHSGVGVAWKGIEAITAVSTGSANDMGLYLYDVSDGSLKRVLRGSTTSGPAGDGRMLWVSS